MQSTRLDRIRSDRPHLSGDPADRAALLATVERLAGVHPVTVTVDSSTPGAVAGLRCLQLRLSHERRDDIRATLLGPTSPGPHPAVLVSPGRNATLNRVTGVEPPDHPDRNVAERLARAGFVTLTMDHGLAPYTGSGRDDAGVLHEYLALTGTSLVGVLVEDTLAGLAWLRGHPWVAPGRVGLFGHSLGAAVALHTAILDGTGAPLCTASHLGSYPVLYQRRRTGPEGGALPGILRHADLPDLYGLLAPAPLQAQYGTPDRFLDPVDAAAAGQVVEAAYRAANAKDHVEILALPMGHGTDAGEATAFFTRTLAGQPRRTPTVPAGRVVIDLPSRMEILDRVDTALASGALTLGRAGSDLEELAAAWTGRPTAAVSSGSSALEIALRIIGVEGRTVLVPANTFFATAASAIRAGARVDLVDLEPDGLGMDPTSLRERLDHHDDVAAVVPVHIAGVVSPALDEVLAECTRRGIDLVEDAAHAIGSRLRQRPAGAFGRLAAFSLYPTKVVTSGEGGLLGCARAEDLDLVRRYRDQGKGSFEANVHVVLGSNWRMSELHAAVGVSHLRRLADMLAERRRLAQWYDAHLTDVPGLRVYRPPAGSLSNYYKYVVLLDDAVDRAALRQRLRDRHRVNLAGEVYATPLPGQPYFADAFAERRLPHAEWFADRHACLPLFTGMSRAQQEAVVEALRAELA